LGSTEGFTLEHLQFLVVDEADRLLNQSYQGWLHKVFQAAHVNVNANDKANLNETYEENMSGLLLEGRTSRLLNAVRSSATQNHSIVAQEPQPLHKLLFSATLTHNPKIIASLQLNNPHFFSAAEEGHFKMPENLQEFMVVCELFYKPLVLLHLMERFDFKRTICFTSSLEATHRLFLLLSLMGQTSIAEYSGHLSQKRRSNIISKFRSGQIKVMIASDAMARGLDIEEIDDVINYDSPAFIKTYVHRAGRTARAGRKGRVFTLLRKEEVHHFKEMLKKIENNTNNTDTNNTNNKVKEIKVDENKDLGKYENKYKESLQKLKELLEPKHLKKIKQRKETEQKARNERINKYRKEILAKKIFEKHAKLSEKEKKGESEKKKEKEVRVISRLKEKTASNWGISTSINA
jgi:ATP-dependent RNA helicase DDX51/DBP6